MNLTTFRTAVRAWIKSALPSFTDAQVIVSAQNAPPPGESDYITVALPSSETLGSMHDLDQNFYDVAQPAGQEIILQRGGTAILRVEVRSYAMSQAGHDAPTDAAQYLCTIKEALNKPSIRAALHAAGMSPFDPGQVIVLPQVRGSVFEGRGTLEVRFYVVEVTTEQTGYIAEVKGSGTLTGSKSTDSVPINFDTANEGPG